MKRKWLVFWGVMIIILLAVTSCASETKPTEAIREDGAAMITPEESENTITITKVVTVTRGTGVCTLLDCQDTVDVVLTGDLTQSFYLQATDNIEKQSAIIQCFNYPQSVAIIENSFEENTAYYSEENIFRFDDPKIQETSELSAAVGLCDTNTGYLIEKRINGQLTAIILQCFSSILPQLQDSGCTSSGVRFYNFSREVLTISLHWNEETKTQVVRPDYATLHPNGPNCEPECKNAMIEISIP